MTLKKNLAAGLTGLILIGSLSACAAAPMAAPAARAPQITTSEGGFAPPRMEVETVSQGDDAFLGAPGQSAAAQPRLVIKNAAMTLIVSDVDGRMTEIKQIAADYNGFVVSQNTNHYNGHTGAQIALRVDSDKLDLALDRLKKLAIEVREQSISGEDVTAEFVDLESNLKNLEAAEAQLKKILDGATKSEDVLAVFKELTQIRGQIDTIKGRMKFLSASAAQSLITLRLIPDAASQPVEPAPWRPSGTVKEAAGTLIRSLQNLADLGIFLAIVVLPQLLIIAAPAALLIWFVRRLLRRARKPAAPTAQPSA
jgi:hypothetical protein